MDGYLTFIGYNTNWTGTTIAANEYIYIGDSARWTGLHKVQEVQAVTGTHGGIKTYTKVSQPVIYATDASVTWVADPTNTITDLLSASPKFSEYFPSNTDIPYISISGGASGAKTQVGLFSGWSFTPNTTLDLSAATHYAVQHNHYSSSPAVLAGDATQAIYIREAFYDNSYVISDVNVLNDESDDIDLPRYLSQALVYYVKAKMAEDQMNIEAKEYMMREFRRMLEKHESSKIAGPRGVMTGSHSIR